MFICICLLNKTKKIKRGETLFLLLSLISCKKIEKNYISVITN